MDVKIIKTSNTTYSVNGKQVIEDFDGRFYSRMELTPSEEAALHEYISKEKISEFNSEAAQ